MALIPFGKPFPGIDSVSLRDGAAAGLVNGFINELKDYEKVPGHTLLGTHADALSIDSFYETLGGVMLVLTNGKVAILNADGSFTALTGPSLPREYAYWAEDGQHVYLATGADLTRVDVSNLAYQHLNENTPISPTHICRSHGFLLTNGYDRVISSNPFKLSQVFDNTGEFNAVVTLTDKPGWILMSGTRNSSPGNFGRIYLSKDNGLSWTKVHTSASPSVPCLCYMGGGVVLGGIGLTTGSILRSTDYGLTWSNLGTQGSSTQINFITKVDTNIAIAGAGSGSTLGEIFRSTDNGATWVNIATPSNFGKQVMSCIVWSTSIVTVGAVNASDVGHIWRSTDAGATFTDVAALDAASFPVDGVKVTSSIGLVALSVYPTGKIYRSADTGATWAPVGTIPNLDADAIPFALLLTSKGDLLFGTSGNNVADGGAQIWKSTDLGVTWNKVVDLDTNKEAIVNCRAMVETHTAGQVIVAGRTLLSTATTASAAKWQTGVGRNSPQGDVFYSEDVANNYQNVDSWGFFNAEQVPDACNGVFEHRSLVFATGPRSIEINYNAPDPNQPWAFSDPSLPFGLRAPHSWVSWDQLDTIMYLTDTDDVVQVVKFRGREQRQISQEYSEILNDRTLITSPSTAKAWGIALRGMPHYVLTFPEDNLTICYNVMTDHWWRWAYWNGTTYEAAIINSYCYWKAQKKHLIGDRRNNGRIYSLGGLTDNGQAIRFELTSGNVTRDTDRLKLCGRIVHKTKRGQATDVSEPSFKVRLRDDGGKWGRYHQVSLGWARQSEFFAAQNQLGSYRARQTQVVHDDTKSDFIYCHADEDFTVGRY